MRAARSFSHGAGLDEEGAPISYEIAAGDDIPDEILNDIPESLILEKVAQSNPEELSREQLLVLAGITTSADEMEPIEYDEESLREAMAELRSKADLAEWFEMIRPTSDQPDPAWTRAEMVDYIIEEMIGE